MLKLSKDDIENMGVKFNKPRVPSDISKNILALEVEESLLLNEDELKKINPQSVYILARRNGIKIQRKSMEDGSMIFTRLA